MAEHRMEGAQVPELLLRGEDHINVDVYFSHMLHQGHTILVCPRIVDAKFNHLVKVVLPNRAVMGD